jgi:tRNA(Glu) U13 pseudouridine synthase TruD
MISESVTSVLDKEQTKNYKKFEYATFKALHRVVLEDEGVPQLKKRGFLMPGYRKIMETGERDVYEKAAKKQLEVKREQLDTQSHDCGSHRNPAFNQKNSSPEHVISGSPTLNKQSITDSLHQDIVPMEQDTESDCLSSI